MFHRPHNRVTAPHSDELVTKQEFKEECDINNILKQYQKTGIITHISKHEASFQDLPDHFDYQEAVNTVMQAEQSFADLPSKVRDHFGNDPQRFLEAFTDPAQVDYLRDVGLLKAPDDPSARRPQEPSGSVAAPEPRGDGSGASSAPSAPRRQARGVDDGTSSGGGAPA